MALVYDFLHQRPEMRDPPIFYYGSHGVGCSKVRHLFMNMLNESLGK